jgi:DNA polymerase
MIYIDFETRSELEIQNVGAWKYSCHPSTKIYCMAYKIDTIPTDIFIREEINQIWDDLKFPDDTDDTKNMFIDHISKFEKLEAHNAFFEYAIWHNIMVARYNWPVIPEDRWYCSAAKAAYHGLPRKLDDVCLALNLDVKKDKEGSRLMKQMCKPRPKWKKTKQGPKWFEDDEKLKRLYEYCKQDVRAEYALSQALDDLPRTERKLWLLDQKINRRGIFCDYDVANSAITIIETLETNANLELHQITDGLVSTPNQTAKILDWLVRENLELPNMQAPTVTEALERTDLTPNARRVLEIRQLHGKASTKKFSAMKDRADVIDQRIRDTLLYHGAHTGRWTGIGIQPQNYYRPDFERSEIELLAIPAILRHDTDELKFLFGSPITPLSSSLRSTLCAAPGYDLIGADYTSIEARTLLWLVKDTDALKLIEQGIDLYIDMAASIYGVPYGQVTKAQRQLGKTAILGLGYGMGVDKFFQTCLNFGIEIDYSLAEKTVSIYRKKYRKVVRYWWKINQHAINATGPFSKHDRFLQLKLPSGRPLHYYDPELTLNRFHNPALSYMSVNSTTRKWEREETYGGKLTENIVQAIARDIMAVGMLRAEKARYPIVMTVHDEVVAEVPRGFGSINEFVDLLCQKEQWYKDCPVSAEGWRGRRYRKD